MAEEYDGIGYKGLGDTTLDTGGFLDYGPFSSTTKVSGFLEYQHPD
jgi:hypothetical protein